MVKNPPANVGDMGLIPGFERSPGGGNGNPLQYSCLKNPTDKQESGGLHDIVTEHKHSSLSLMYKTTDWFQIGKGVHQGCILSPWLFNLHAEYIMRNAELDEAQAGIKIARGNVNNLR